MTLIFKLLLILHKVNYIVCSAGSASPPSVSPCGCTSSLRKQSESSLRAPGPVHSGARGSGLSLDYSMQH